MPPVCRSLPNIIQQHISGISFATRAEISFAKKHHFSILQLVIPKLSTMFTFRRSNGAGGEDRSEALAGVRAAERNQQSSVLRWELHCRVCRPLQSNPNTRVGFTKACRLKKCQQTALANQANHRRPLFIRSMSFFGGVPCQLASTTCCE